MDDAAIACAREYYWALDDHDYDALAALLAPAFVHVRPDRTLDGRERFVRFMREERPNRHTRHRVDALYRPVDGVSGADAGDGGDGDGESGDRDDESGHGDDVGADAVAQGRLLDLEGDGEALFEFVDVFGVDGERIHRVDTYARSV